MQEGCTRLLKLERIGSIVPHHGQQSHTRARSKVLTLECGHRCRARNHDIQQVSPTPPARAVREFQSSRPLRLEHFER